VNFFTSYVQNLQGVLDQLNLAKVEGTVKLLAEARDRGQQIFLCGNGGSASTASHMANDLGKGASLGRKMPFKVISLTDNIPWMTALANDLSYEAIFSEQLRNFAQADDVLIAISGSGNSQNVLNAVEVAREKGMKTIGWIGFGGGKLASMVDVPIVVDSNHMGRVEDAHVILMHLVCYYFMEQES
jgi:D-sedoheptulose 7-phosphate isomerase